MKRKIATLGRDEFIEPWGDCFSKILPEKRGKDRKKIKAKSDT